MKTVWKILANLKTPLQEMADYLFPRNCHICNSRLDADSRYICPTCLSKLPRTRFHRMKLNPVEQRFAGRFPFERATAHFFYSSSTEISYLMQDLKYRHFRGLASYLGEVVATELFPVSFFTDIDGIVPIPMHWFKKGRRGYNQVDCIAEGISRITSLPILTNLRASKAHRTQTKMSALQRLNNLTGTFKVINPEELDGKHILLLDDVCTTGSTLITAAEALHSASPNLRLTILTLAATY